MPPKVLISDKLSPSALQVFKDHGVEADYQPTLGKDPDALLSVIAGYDGLAVRSATKVTAQVIEAASGLKVIGRAGIGVDNIDRAAATARGVLVMNTPSGNAITTAEHTLAMIMATARRIPAANASTHAGKWEKSRFMGVELCGKTLGLIGCGNIGAIVADRARGLRMRVIAYDPFLSVERAGDLGVEKVDFETLMKRSDVISLHAPLTPKTRSLINAQSLAMTRKGVFVINCARGGLVVEEDLRQALLSGHVAGAGVDVFEKEPAHDSPLFGLDNVVCTPHLGASTTEAQEKVALQIAEQISAYLTSGAVANALNMPPITAEEAPRLKPYVALSEQLGSFAGQMTENPIKSLKIEYGGEVCSLNTGALTSALLMGLLRPMLGGVNIVSAPHIARERGIEVDEVCQTPRGVYDSYIRLTVKTEKFERTVAGTVFSDGRPRIIQVKGIGLDVEFGEHMLYIANEDRPGFVGSLGTILGELDINIASFHMGRESRGGDSIALVKVDGPLNDDVLAQVRALPWVRRAHYLSFTPLP